MKENALRKKKKSTIGGSKNSSLQTGLCKVDRPLLFGEKKKMQPATHWIKSVEKQTCSNLKHIIILSIHKCLKSVSCYEHIHPFSS